MGVTLARPVFDTVMFQFSADPTLTALNFSRTLGPSADVSVRHDDRNSRRKAQNVRGDSSAISFLSIERQHNSRRERHVADATRYSPRVNSPYGSTKYPLLLTV